MRQSFYISLTGINECEVQQELSKFMNDLNERYKNKGFGATVLGMTKEATEHVEKYLNK